MKKLIPYILALITFMACTAEPQERTGMDPSLEGKPVTITFSLPDVPILSPSTKSLDDKGDISGKAYLDPEKLYLVVCGETQSIKYIRKAEVKRKENGDPELTQVSISSIDDYPLDDEQGEQYVYMYTFTVQLELSDRPRTIHFLGNIDENQLITGSYSYQVLPTLLSYEGKQAYWQKVYVENIHADPDIPPVNGSYSPDTYITNRLKYVPLIRNYAKIQVTDRTDKETLKPEEQFELYSYAVIHYPLRGSVVPYRYNANDKKDTFSFPFGDGYSSISYRLSGYEKCNFETLEQLGYQGHLPSGVTFKDKDDIPSEEEFINPDGKTVIRYNENDPDQGIYVYERSIPTASMEPTFVIIRGKFGNDKEYYFYRLDLMETKQVNNESIAQYYPIYRNFRYNIELNRISSQGLSTPLAAAKSTGAVDISADISMRHLSDISNGQTRLVVEPFMAWTYTGPPEKDEYYYLYARFFNNLNSDEPNMDWGAVTVELEPMDDQSADILTLYDDTGGEIHGGGFFYPKPQEVGGVPGFRVIRFRTKEPGDKTKTQKIKIIGRNFSIYEEYPLYREVEISLQSKQNMTVTCNNPELSRMTGSQQIVSVTIPAGLPSSMFPLKFIMEAEDKTLTPDNKVQGNNLPVQTGLSISDNADYAGKTTFQFVRTLTLDEYKRNTHDGFCTFDSYFKSNRPASATTVWVDNEYFYKKSVSFTNQAEVYGHFYVEADEICYVRINIDNLEYKMDDGDWNIYTKNGKIKLDPTQRVYFRSNSNTAYNGGIFQCSSKENMSNKEGNFHVGGNIASLLVGNNFETDGPGIKSYTFLDFFKSHTGLNDASDLVIPMESAPGNCFKSMFDSCTGLLDSPKILPATSLGATCYRNMFYNCSSLRSAPLLPSQTAGSAYQRMFYGCSNLTVIKMRVSTYNKDNFVSDGNTKWVAGVAESGTIYLNSSLPLSVEAMANIVPDGWEVIRLAPNSEDWYK